MMSPNESLAERDAINANLRELSRNVYHVYEKSPAHGYRMMSKLHVLRKDGRTKDTTWADDDEASVLRQFKGALRRAQDFAEAAAG